MESRYANTQAAGYSNYIRKVAIVGASGQMGTHITDELLRSGTHEVTAITRASASNNSFPAGIKVAKVDYDSESSLVAALKGSDALVITMGARAPPEESLKLVEAAAKADVKWVLPNEWGLDSAKVELGKDVLLGPHKAKVRERIEQLGMSFVAISCGQWYEYSLAAGLDGYGFDFANKVATFYGDGNTRLSTSTWEQTARAAITVLNMKILPDDEHDQSESLERTFKNKFAYIQSFLLSQRDMLESILRVTGENKSDWTIRKDDVKARFENAKKTVRKGDFSAYRKLLYSRVFFPEEEGNFEKHHRLSNDILGLKQEDLDQCTAKAISRAEMIVSGELQ